VTLASTYIFETKGQVLDIKDDYALVMFGQVLYPNIWLRVDQLEPFKVNWTENAMATPTLKAAPSTQGASRII